MKFSEGIRDIGLPIVEEDLMNYQRKCISVDFYLKNSKKIQKKIIKTNFL